MFNGDWSDDEFDRGLPLPLFFVAKFTVYHGPQGDGPFQPIRKRYVGRFQLRKQSLFRITTWWQSETRGSVCSKDQVGAVTLKEGRNEAGLDNGSPHEG